MSIDTISATYTLQPPTATPNIPTLPPLQNNTTTATTTSRDNTLDYITSDNINTLPIVANADIQVPASGTSKHRTLMRFDRLPQLHSDEHEYLIRVAKRRYANEWDFIGVHDDYNGMVLTWRKRSTQQQMYSCIFAHNRIPDKHVYNISRHLSDGRCEARLDNDNSLHIPRNQQMLDLLTRCIKRYYPMGYTFKCIHKNNEMYCYDRIGYATTYYTCYQAHQRNPTNVSGKLMSQHTQIPLRCSTDVSNNIELSLTYVDNEIQTLQQSIRDTLPDNYFVEFSKQQINNKRKSMKLTDSNDNEDEDNDATDDDTDTTLLPQPSQQHKQKQSNYNKTPPVTTTAAAVVNAVNAVESNNRSLYTLNAPINNINNDTQSSSTPSSGPVLPPLPSINSPAIQPQTPINNNNNKSISKSSTPSSYNQYSTTSTSDGQSVLSPDVACVALNITRQQYQSLIDWCSERYGSSWIYIGSDSKQPRIFCWRKSNPAPHSHDTRTADQISSDNRVMYSCWHAHRVAPDTYSGISEHIQKGQCSKRSQNLNPMYQPQTDGEIQLVNAAKAKYTSWKFISLHPTISNVCVWLLRNNVAGQAARFTCIYSHQENPSANIAQLKGQHMTSSCDRLAVEHKLPIVQTAIDPTAPQPLFMIKQENINKQINNNNNSNSTDISNTNNKSTKPSTKSSTHICALPGCNQHASRYCSQCKSTYYCSEQCQTNDWNRHGELCLPAEQIEATA